MAITGRANKSSFYLIVAKSETPRDTFVEVILVCICFNNAVLYFLNVSSDTFYVK